MIVLKIVGIVVSVVFIARIWVTDGFYARIA